MSKIWTCHLGCFTCGKDFIINRVDAEGAYAAAALIPCPHCGAAPSTDHTHHLNYLQAVNLPYRRQQESQVWHFSEYCSHWPADDYVELDYPPAAEVCNECKALAGS